VTNPSCNAGGPALRSSVGFSLIELLIVIAVIGIIGALVLTSVTNATRDSNLVIARQQQVVLQEALNAWIVANSSGSKTLQDARTLYAGNKLDLLKDFLQKSTYDHFKLYSSGNNVKSDAMEKAGVSLQFSSWQDSSEYPYIEMTSQ